MKLLLLLASFPLTVYAGLKLLGGRDPAGVALWIVAAAVLHDLVLLPLYGLLDRGAQGVLGRAYVNYVRVPAFVSGLLLLVYFPLILGLSADRYESFTALSPDGFLARWLLITAALFLASALVLAVRRSTGRRGTSAPR